MRFIGRSDAYVCSVFACISALTILVLTAGAIVTAGRDSTPSPESTAEAHRASADANRTLLSAALRSNAVVSEKRTPDLRIHFFGLPGADSLNAAVESHVLSTIENTSGFDGHDSFSPPPTLPVHRWPADSFAPRMPDSEAPSASSDQTATGDEALSGTDPAAGRADNRALDMSAKVLAAGGRYLLTALQTSSPDPHQTVLLTDLASDETVDARMLFTTVTDSAVLFADSSGALTHNGDTFDDDELTDLGRRVLPALDTPLDLPEPTDLRSPDFTCALLPCVALTYDDGPGDGRTEQTILDAADEANIRVTYFFLGENIGQSPEVARKVAAAGHEINSHTYSHLKLDDSKSRDIREELGRTRKLLRSTGVHGDPLVRPPYGALDKRSAHAVGAPAIIWDVDTEDWRSKGPKKVVKRVRKRPARDRSCSCIRSTRRPRRQLRRCSQQLPTRDSTQ